MLDCPDDNAYGLKVKTIQVAGIALLVLGMRILSDVSVLAESGKLATENARERQKGDRLCQVRGYFDVDGRRLNFVDGIIRFSPYWADRWDPYSIVCKLVYTPFNATQLKDARSGRWIDIDYQTLPAGFPDDRIKGEQRLPRAPCVVIDIGNWPLGTPPAGTCTNVSIGVRGFVSPEEWRSFTLSSNQISQCTINLTTGLVVHVQTAGQYKHGEHEFAWDISVIGRSYADPWPIKVRIQHYKQYDIFKDYDSGANHDLQGLTVTERLFVRGLIEKWEDAVRRKNRQEMIKLLENVALTEDKAVRTTDAVLQNPKQYGF